MKQRIWEMNFALGIVTLVGLGLTLLPTVAEAKPNKQLAKEQKTSSDLLGAATSAGGTASDLAASATHDGGHGGEKFFMYAHQPDKKEYEFGFKRGNGYHTIERYEKGGPHHNFKTKVRWNDSKGGHGEHYWDYNHAPKYHDDHHDDHHGGGDGYHDDHHGDDHHGSGYGQDHHDDHGGYHSQPVPEFLPAASRSFDTTSVATPFAVPPGSSKPKIGKREGIARPSKVYESTDVYRLKQKPTKKTGNKVDVDKDSGQNKKHFHTYSEKQTFEYKSSSIPDDKDMEKVESPSAFPELLGFNPYLPPEISREKHYPESFLTGQQSSASSEISSSSFPTTFEHRTGLVGKNESASISSSAKDNVSAESIVSDQVSSSLPTVSGLSYDTDTGRIYDDATGMWFYLVPVEVEKEE